MYKRATSALPFSLFFVWIITIICSISLSLDLLLPTLVATPIIAYLLFREITIRSFLLSPKRTHLPEEIDGWELIEYWRDDYPVRALLQRDDSANSLAVLIHGWQSSTSRMNNRLKWWRNKGYASLALEVRGHGNAVDEKEWTALKIAEDLTFILEKLADEMKEIERVILYGHSLGGFILLRALNNHGWWSDKVHGIILESPMSSYPLILQESKMYSSFIGPLVKRWLIHSWETIHPLNSPMHLESVEAPLWGLPNNRTLLIQAEHDTRLGRDHFNHLVKSFEDAGKTDLLSKHLVPELEHSRNDICPQRDEIIESWL